MSIAIDVVCGMEVDTADAQYRHDRLAATYQDWRRDLRPAPTFLPVPRWR